MFFRLLSSLVFLFVTVTAIAAGAVGPYSPSNVGNTIRYPSNAGTTYTKSITPSMGGGAGSMSNGALRIENWVKTQLPKGGVTIDAKLVTDIERGSIKDAIKGGLKSGMFSPAGVAKGLITQMLIDKLIEAGLQWQQDTQEWLKKPLDDGSLWLNRSSSYGAPNGLTATEWAAYAKQQCANSFGGSCPYTYTIQDYGNGYGCLAFNGTCRDQMFKTGGVNPQAGTKPTDSELDDAANKAAGGIDAESAAKALDAAGNSFPSEPSFAEIPDATQKDSTTPEKEISRSTDSQGNTTTQTESTHTTASATNNYITYNQQTITNTYVNGTKTKTETKDEDSPPVPPDPEMPKPSDIPLPSMPPPPFTLNIPTIPTGFACNDPQFDIPMFGMSFLLPLCRWIEKFRGLFEWFWSVCTAIGIYILVRGVNIRTGEAK